MHIPKINENNNLEEIKAFIHANSFGILVTTQADSVPIATHIPIELAKNAAGEDVLVGHIAKANPQVKTLQDGKDVLAIFSSPHSYISSSWYQHATTVPTWNYIAVHVYGKLRILSNEELHASLVDLVDKYEQAIAKKPMQLSDLPEKNVFREMRGIVGFEVAITDIQARYKLSQNRHAEDYQHIMDELEALEDSGAAYIADEMKKLREKDI
jgi:transcriptional regulator